MMHGTSYEWLNNVTDPKVEYTCTAVKGGSKAMFSSNVGSYVTKAVVTISGAQVDIDYSEVSYFYV